MLKRGMLTGLFTIFIFSVFGQHTFTCYENDHNKNLKIYVCYDEDGTPLYVKYKGQRDSIPVFFKVRKDESKGPEGGIPAYYWTDVYVEKYKGKITGEYSFTNANYLMLFYKRKKDGKEFDFTAPHDESSGAGGAHNTKPCF